MCRLQPEGVPTLQPELASLVSAWLVSTGKRMRQEEWPEQQRALPGQKLATAGDQEQQREPPVMQAPQPNDAEY